MRRFKITATITAGDSYQTGEVRMQIDRDLNRGDGIYLHITEAEIVGIKDSHDDSTEQGDG